MMNVAKKVKIVARPIKKFVKKNISKKSALLKIIDEQHQYIIDIRKELAMYKTWVEPGHFYSPITTDSSFKRSDNRKELPGIKLNSADQLFLLKKFAKHCAIQPFEAEKSKENRYYFNNDQFSYSDGLTLFCMLLETQPSKIIEVVHIVVH